MWIKRGIARRAFLAALICGVALSSHAQSGADEPPLSAIDWLSESLSQPATVPPVNDIASTAIPDAVSTTPLGQLSPDGIGLLPPAITGLPAELWGSSGTRDLANRIAQLDLADMLPATLALTRILMLTEANPPLDATPEPVLLLARVDALLAMGALDQAAALMDAAGPTQPELFRRWFDTALLTGTETRACAALRETASLSPSYPARIFCLARSGDWNAAVLTLNTARALGVVTEAEDHLLAMFLDLEDERVSLPPPSRPTPLEFRLYEAIGEPLPTATLPLAFAHADLRTTSGWRARIEAAERLARAGAIAPGELMAIYSESRPAASGATWDRVAAVQALDAALEGKDRAAIASALQKAWTVMHNAELEPVLAEAFALRLAAQSLPPEAARIAAELGLLSSRYAEAAQTLPATDDRMRFLGDVARGRLTGLVPNDPQMRAVAEALGTTTVPARFAAHVDQGRLGEALLRALQINTAGAMGEIDDLTDSLALFNALGLTDTARRAALQLLILDRRG